MQNLSFSYTYSQVSKQKLRKIMQQLQSVMLHINQVAKTKYANDYASLYLPFDTAMHEQVQEIVIAKKALNPSLLIVIGIGGSHLATLAVIEALYGIFYNDRAAMPVFFADSVDVRYTKSVYDRAEHALKNGETVLITIISKSGTTIETIANAQLFTALLARYQKKYQDYVVIITDEESSLWNVGQQHGMACLPIPDKVGGRFSAFSPVGLFPLGMLGIDIKMLIAGACSIFEYTDSLTNNSAALSAAILYAQYRKKLVIHNSFFFVAQFEGIGKWYRQLLAESIGKTKKT